MANAEFNIQELFGKVKWRLPFPLAFSGNISDYSLLTREQSEQPIPPAFSGELSKPVWAEVVIDNIEFNIPPIVTVSSQLNVVSTPVAGQDGTVKEIISVEDYRVNLRLLLTDFQAPTRVSSSEGFSFSVKNTRFPDAKIREVRNLFERKESVRVVSSYLSLFGIDYLLVTNISFPDIAGLTEVVPCELECISDKPQQIELEL